MKATLGKILFKISRKFLGFFDFNISISASTGAFPELSAEDKGVCESVFRATITMTSLEALNVLALCCKYVDSVGLPGAFVEVGVWRGGSSIVAKKCFTTPRKLYLYDTYAGMTKPSEKDFRVGSDSWISTLEKWKSLETKTGNKWVAASLEEVKKNFQKFECLDKQIVFKKGDVRSLLLEKIDLPPKIALLRLDTDFYDSTLVSLETLWPLLVNKGVLILDDYGHWDGARRAVDEYFGRIGIRELMIPFSGGGRVLVKNSD